MLPPGAADFRPRSAKRQAAAEIQAGRGNVERMRDIDADARRFYDNGEYPVVIWPVGLQPR